jgi:dTDP-4-dehydrorhamnose 3,5-epimerase
MKITELEFKDLIRIEPDVFGDERGFFFEFWNESKLRAEGFNWKFVQDNVSRSAKGVLRGLHFQNPRPQGKLISVLEGEVYDVVVDLRKSSRTFKKWTAIQLTGQNHVQVYVPPGVAHGFQVLSETALFAYKCTEVYNSSVEWTVKWDDPDLKIAWPLSNPSLSKKDQVGISLRQLGDAAFFE